MSSTLNFSPDLLPRGLGGTAGAVGLTHSLLAVDLMGQGEDGMAEAGGGGLIATSGTASGNLHVTNYFNSGVKQDQIASVFRSIENALSSDTGCSNWLQGGGVSGTDLIQALLSNNSFGYGDFDQNNVAAFAGQANADGSSVGVPVTSAITVNANGAFFSSGFVEGAKGYIGGTIQAQATILIHELAHVLGAAGFQNDAGNSTAGHQNDALVDKNCGKLIGGRH
jgi:hypothetical protein